MSVTSFLLWSFECLTLKKEVIMSLVRRENNNNWLNQWPRLFDDFLSRDVFDSALSNFSATDTTLPAVNIKETDDHFEVEMAAPGMTKKDFKIELQDNTLIISSEKQDMREEQGKEQYTRREFSYQSFQRVFNLPKEVVDEDKIKASYDNGVLHLLIPKKEEVKKKPARTIAIS